MTTEQLIKQWQKRAMVLNQKIIDQTELTSLVMISRWGTEARVLLDCAADLERSRGENDD